MYKFQKLPLLFIALLFIFASGTQIFAQQKNTNYFIRFKVTKPSLPNAEVSIGGNRHAGSPWYFDAIQATAAANQWSDWIDLSGWEWHEKLDRSGGIAEYPAITLTVKNSGGGSEFEVQLADKPAEKSVVVSFTEQSSSNRIVFLAPFPLREKAKDFETASQMIERQAKWAKEATGGKPIKLNKFEIITNFWTINNSALEEKSISLLQSLGFNTIGAAEDALLEKYDLNTYRKIWIYNADPEFVKTNWAKTAQTVNQVTFNAEGKQLADRTKFWEISDEIRSIYLKDIEKQKLNGWFNEYLKTKGVETAKPWDFPVEELYSENLPQNGSLEERKNLYYAAKFGHWWSGKQLKQISDLIIETQPGVKTSSLLPSHGFMGNAWGKQYIGMGFAMLDIFELAQQNSVKQLAVEDWFGLNHMYGVGYTWTGGQSFGYYNALIRSAIGDEPIKIQGLITPSDDKYLRLKAFSSLGQGAKSFDFWSYGPTYVSTENYWSDLRSEYDGIAKLTRSLQKSEDVLYPAKTQTDDVAILYSVSHDIWNNDNQAAFVEKRLLWHALRHLQIQPNFLREEDVETGKLDKYKVLYIADWNITRRASAEIDKWVKNGGTLYLSAGAATRDEFNEPFVPAFAKDIWIKNPSNNLTNEKSTFNERTVLPTIKPLTTATVEIDTAKFELPAIGVRLDLEAKLESFAKFKDGKNAAAIVSYGKGRIVAVGFMPMLAYGKSANFQPTTLEEKWQPEPRLIIEKALELAKVDPIIKTNVPVVETSLLEGVNGAAIVLANYTYQPINLLQIDVKIKQPIKTATSVEGKTVKILKQTNGRITLELPLEWTDIIILK